MKIREHRLLLDDAMTTCKDIEPTMAAVINQVVPSLPCFLGIKPEDIHVKPYGYDKRIVPLKELYTIQGVKYVL